MVNIYLGYVAPLSAIVPLALLAPRYRRVQPHVQVLFWYLLTGFLMGNISSEMARHGYNNLWLIHIYTVVEFLFLLYFFSFLLSGPDTKKIFLGLAVIFPLYCVFNAVFLQSPFIFNTYTRPLGALICLILCIIYWWRVPAQDERPWADVPENWMVAGIVIYNASSFFVFLFSNYLQEWVQATRRRSVFEVVWYIHASLLMVMYLMFSIGFLKCKRPATISSI